MSVVMLSGPSSPVSLPTPSVGLAALDVSATCASRHADTGLCGRAAGQAAAASSSATAAAAVTTTTACSGLLLLLNDCPGGPTTTTTTSTTTTTTEPPTTTTTSGPAPTCQSSVPSNVPLPAGESSWTCTLDNEFDGTSLTTSSFSPLTTASTGYTTGAAASFLSSPTAGTPCYVNNSSTVNESGGTLNISIVQVPKMTCTDPSAVGGSFPTDYEGGDVNTLGMFSQEYGYFETSAEMPASAIDGLQETLWLWPVNQDLHGSQWPDSGEIDYAEFYSEYPQYDVPVVHYPGSSTAQSPTSDTDACADAMGRLTAGQFNTYALAWTPTTITAYFNNVPCITDTYAPRDTETPPAPFDQPFFLNFTAALGVNTNAFKAGTTPLPATTKIQWMRVWR
jgi:beta-glucanase (GH16 family)